jgi:hypothetical protein
MTTDLNDLVLDPFGGSGTTFAVCEKKRRKWIGIELESANVIVERLERNDVHDYKNEDFIEAPKRRSLKRLGFAGGPSLPRDSQPSQTYSAHLLPVLSVIALCAK